MNDATSRTLFGVGVGPGDPELVTVKTVRILREADVILVPYTEATTDGPGRAESIITAVAPEIAGRIRRIPFSMRERSGVGEKRKLKLLRQFGSIERIARASREELSPFIGAKTAGEVFEHFERQRKLAGA